MNATLLLASTFFLVFGLGLQTQLVGNGHYLMAFVTSALISVAQLGAYQVIGAQTHVEYAAYILGGPAGCVFSMVLYRRFFAKRTSMDTKTESFQQRVSPWILECFGPMVAGDREERNHRFLEEALELVQACGATEWEAHQLVDYVYGRPVGEKKQEAGGVMVTLAALCIVQDMDMHQCGETELARVWTKIVQIREKHAAKPKYSPLAEWSRDNGSVECSLLLTSQVTVPFEVIKGWSDEQCRLAQDWAIALHLNASDNDDVEVPSMPDFLRAYMVPIGG